MLHRLMKHLAVLRRHGLITEWYDRAIDAGADWRQEIARQIEGADVILLLVSADFLNSDFCYEQEMLRAVERSDRGEATVIAVILRPVDGWESTPFARLQVVPRDGRPITKWSNADEAYSDAAAKIRSALADRIRSASLRGRPSRIQPVRAAGVKVDTHAAGRLREIRAVLNDLMRQSKADEFVIFIGDPRKNYFTQCTMQEDAIWCEAVSNGFLEPKYALGSAQTSDLVGLGWSPPAAGAENWWCIKTDAEAVATLMVGTLSDVYGVSAEQPLKIEKSW
jgi:hypothetical protein